jgi:NAD(P)H-dependent flavin oxidoreductase YrpB (nitropropane dioxygenase family)
VQSRAAQDIFVASAEGRDGEHYPMFSGQGAGLIHDLPGAAEVIETIVREARQALQTMGKTVRLA